MTTLQKIAALVLRLTAVAMIVYAALLAAVSFTMLGGIVWSSVLIYLLGGLVVFASAVPLAKITTVGLGE